MLGDGQTSRESHMRGLGDLKAAIMSLLWAEERTMSVREVRDGLANRREWAYTTVMTVLDTLHSKGWLTRSRRGRAYIYQPVAGREAYVAELMGQALLDSGDRASAFLRFVSAMTPEDTAALREALRRVENDPKAKGD